MIKTGIKKIRDENLDLSSYGRIGLLANQASLDNDFTPSWQIIQKLSAGNLTTLFGPQHGFEATVQDNMIETAHSMHPKSGLPVYSLYSETRRPSKEMLDNIDTLFIDLQITGCRVYTFKWTIAECLRACQEFGKKVVVLDRPNPLGGVFLEGRVLDEDCFSFVGQEKIPMRHGLTPGELAKFVNRNIGCDLEVVALENWSPDQVFDELGLPWVLTSPNLPTFDSVSVYPGTVLFEATNVSEGRGTSLPFQFIGSPYLSAPYALISYLEQSPKILRGITLRASSFMPTSQKWANQTCNGIQIHVLDAQKVNSFKLSLALCNAFYLKKGFEWASPGYEYNFDDSPIELVLGSKQVSTKFGEGFNIDDPFWEEGIKEYIEIIKPFLLYSREQRIVS